uniref:Uncharacterized protein n=1 Tax=Alexandrium monilatum TaxID=311494 RepID=A0A6T1J0W8_9DINO
MAGATERQMAADAVLAEIRRLRLENWQLRGELRRELSQEACVGRLHCQHMAASSQQRSEADASAGAPPSTESPPPPPAQGAGGRSRPDTEGLQAALSEAEDKSRRLREEVASLQSALREPQDLRALREEVGRMRQLLAQPEEEEPGEEIPGERPQGGSEGGRGVLLAEVSFEMLATIGEAELAEEKKALQREVRRLQGELDNSSGSPRTAPTAQPGPTALADVPSLRQHRRLQHVDAIAQRLHEEFQLRAAPKQPPAEPPGDAADGAPELAKEVAVDLRSQMLEQKIRAFSRRFALVRDLC